MSPTCDSAAILPNFFCYILCCNIPHKSMYQVQIFSHCYVMIVPGRCCLQGCQDYPTSSACRTRLHHPQRVHQPPTHLILKTCPPCTDLKFDGIKAMPCGIAGGKSVIKFVNMSIQKNNNSRFHP